MSQKNQGETAGDERHRAVPVPQRSRQQNGTSPGEPPVRRSWRPCQLHNQDGEPNPHHQHHHHPNHHRASGSAPSRHRRRPHPGHRRDHIQAQEVSATNERAATESMPVQHPRPAVSRYRCHGDLNNRARSHRQNLAIKEKRELSPDADKPDSPDMSPKASDVSLEEHLQEVAPSHQTPVAVVSPTHLSTYTPPEEAECDVKCEDEPEGAKEMEEDVGDGEQPDSKSVPEEAAVTEETSVGEPEEPQDVASQESEITDLCSDTESAGSLSMDGPLHSPPPLQSPTPPSSPDSQQFPPYDHFSEETSMSPLPDSDLPLDDEEESCESLPQPSLSSEYYPKTYAEFYSESHQKSYLEAHPSPKVHPNCFPEPLRTAYPEAQRELCTQSAQKPEPEEEEPCVRQESVQLAPPVKSSHCAPRSLHSPMSRSVGCRLHHYDAQSDGESNDQSPIHKTRAQTKTSAVHYKTPVHHEQDETDRTGEGETKASGDSISLVIRDIREAIEEVKTKTVRSPYTPDHTVEPIWVMRREDSPTDEEDPSQPSEDNATSLLRSESMSRCAPPPRQPSSKAEPSRAPRTHHKQSHHHQHGHSSQQRDSARQLPTQTHNPQRQISKQSPPQQQQLQPQSPAQQMTVQELRRSLPPFPTFVDVPGPCDPDDLIDGIIFAASYLGCTHLLSERTPTKSARMQQAQEAMSRVRAAQKQAKNKKKRGEGEGPSTAEVDLFMSTQRIKVLNADTQESLMDLPLRTISYIADIGNMVVLMARGKMVRSRSAQENLEETAEDSGQDDRRLYRMICHVFESEDAQLIAQSIGQSFSVAYQEFLRANGIDPQDLSQREYSDLLNTQDMYNDDLIHFSKSENCRDVYIEKQKGEILGVVIVESGWGSILPTVIIASLMHGGPAEKSGRLNIGDQIMTINGTSLVGLPLTTCQSIIKGLKSQSRIKMNMVRCPPVTMVLIRRPDLRYQLGFSVQNGIICSLMRGGIAERGGVRVGHRIIEINGQSVVATAHEKIVQILSNAMGEIHMKTMPAAMYRLLTAQEQPVYI
ncbi:uncharacterized protein ACB057_000818 [Neosynchiropus ocellatus]